MSFPKKGKSFPNGARGKGARRSDDLDGAGGYAQAIATALHVALGSTNAAAKTAAGWTGASERTAKNWLAGTNSPCGGHLVELLRNSDEVLDAVLRLAGRPDLVAAKKLLDARQQLLEMLAIIEAYLSTMLDHS